VNPIQPIEPPRPLQSSRRVDRERGGEPGNQPQSGRDDDRRDEDETEDDGLPHVDVRA